MFQQPSQPEYPREVVSTRPIAAVGNLLDAMKAVPDGSSGGSGPVVIPPVESVQAGARLGNAIFQAVQSIVILFARGFIAPVEVLLRHSIGERYFSVLVMLGTIASLAWMTLFFNPITDTLIQIFLVSVVGVGFHNLVCFFRDRRGDYWHSYSEGQSRLRIPAVDEWLSKRFFTFDHATLLVEPLILFGAGILAITFLPTDDVWVTIPGREGEWVSYHPVGIYLVLAAPVLFCYQLYCWSYRRQRILDEKDAQAIAEARKLAQVVMPRPTLRSFQGVIYRPQIEAVKWSR